jgi:cytochrome bd-type quinol oxidase subunit 2
MLVGIQLWELIGSISGAFSRLTVAGLSVCGYQFDEAGRLLFGVPIPALPTALFILADLATISAITAGCWWLIQRNEKRLSFTLRRRGALIYGGIALCLTLLSVGLLNWLSFTVFNKLNEAKAASIMSMSAGMMVISFIKPIALVVLTVLIARRQIRLASVR